MTDTENQQQPPPSKGIKKKGKKGKNPEFGAYIYKILKTVEPNVGISGQGMWVINGLVSDFLNRTVDKSFKMAKYDGKTTLKSKHAQGAASNMLTGDMLRLGVAAGTKALVKFTAAA